MQRIFPKSNRPTFDPRYGLRQLQVTDRVIDGFRLQRLHRLLVWSVLFAYQFSYDNVPSHSQTRPVAQSCSTLPGENRRSFSHDKVVSLSGTASSNELRMCSQGKYTDAVSSFAFLQGRSHDNLRQFARSVIHVEGPVLSRLRCRPKLHEGEWKFNNIHSWNYHLLPQVYGGGVGFEVSTESEFDAALTEAWNNRTGPSILHVHIGKTDHSPPLNRLAERMAARV